MKKDYSKRNGLGLEGAPDGIIIAVNGILIIGGLLVWWLV